MKQRSIFWLSLLSLIFLTGAASAQSSLYFTDATSGQRVDFTPFGTMVFQPQGLVSGGWRVNYQDRSGGQSIWYFNSQLNSGVQPVSLTANFPNGQVLNRGTRLYVRAVMRSADGKLRITQRFIWDAGNGPISSVLTVENTSNSPLNVNDVIVWRPEEPPPVSSEVCPYIPPIDGFTAARSIVIIGTVRYVRTVISFTTTPLQPSQSRDVPTDGCHGGTDAPQPPS